MSTTIALTDNGQYPISDADAHHSTTTDGGYGWVCVISVFIINAHTWGLNSAYSVFLSFYLNNEIFPDASPIVFAFIGGLSISQAFLIAPLVTKMTASASRRIFKASLYLGALLQVASFIGASFAHRTWQLILSQGICFGWGMGLLFVGTVGILPHWFERRTGLANAIAASGSGVGGLTYSLVTRKLITQVGFQWTLRILGIISIVMNSGATYFLERWRKKDDRGSVSPPRVRCLWTQTTFYVLLSYGIFSLLGYVICLFSLPSFAEALGFSSEDGSLVAALLNVGQIVGRTAVGYLCDRLGRLNVTAAASLLTGIFALLMWTFTTTLPTLLAFGFITGCVAGTFFAVIAPLTADVVGLSILPPALSIVWLSLVIPSTFSQPIAQWIQDSSNGSYTGVQLFTGFAYVSAALSVWILRALLLTSDTSNIDRSRKHEFIRVLCHLGKR